MCNGKGESLQTEHSSESSRAKILKNCSNGGWRITLEPGGPQVQQSPCMLVTLALVQNYKTTLEDATNQWSLEHPWGVLNYTDELLSALKCRQGKGGENLLFWLPQLLPFTSPQSTGQIHISCDLNIARTFWRNIYSLSNRTGLRIRPHMSCH